MNKRVFIKQVRAWQAVSVEQALHIDPILASFVDQTGKTPLHHCAGINAEEANLSVAKSLRTARALLLAGADVNAVRVIIDEGEEFLARPLWYAVAWGRNLGLAKLLLENGALPVGCMWAACWAQDRKMAELLRTHGAAVDPVFHGETPLLQIVKAKRFCLLPWLIENGADVNFQDEQGLAALHYAVKRNHNLGQIEELLRYGAKPTLAARDGVTPLSLAHRLGKTELVQLLENFEVMAGFERKALRSGDLDQQQLARQESSG